VKLIGEGYQQFN